MTRARARAVDAGFTQSSDGATGELLAVLAAAVPRGGRILEIGTGVGVGLAWLVAGLGARTDVEVVSLEQDPTVAVLAASHGWPARVRLITGDALAVLPELGRFSLIFADAPAGKWTGLDGTLAALEPGGVLLVDDMRPPVWASADHEAHTRRVRATLLGHATLVATELSVGSGLIVCTRRS
ncbi:hypothetical protein GCM10009682_39460 [Luedemannella flava]|uniref:O-methyltransferase YrrM n=1 Tax=Luedemannella flava TaxID=349316 RepID=A0ABN2M894_9ACTN